MMTKIRNISLFAYIFLSFIGPTVLDSVRFALLLTFILVSLIQNKPNPIPTTYFVLGFIIICYNAILLSFSIVHYPITGVLEAKSIILYFSIYFLLTSFITVRQLLYIDNAILAATVFISFYFAYILFGKLGMIPFFIGDFLQQDYFIAASHFNAKIYALHLNSLTYLIPYIFFKTLNRDGRQVLNLAVLAMGFLTVLLSLRRGIILSTMVGSFLAIAFTTTIKRIKPIQILLVFSLSTICVIILFHFFNIDTKKYFEAITSSFDFSTNRSNAIRTEQFNFLLDKIKGKPLFGHGIGAYDPHYYRSDSNPANFELQYVKMIFASGFLGFFLNLAFTGLAFYQATKLYKLSDFHKKMLLPVLAGWLAALIYNASNPLITQLGPYFMFFHIFYVINVLTNDQSQISDLRTKQ